MVFSKLKSAWAGLKGLRTGKGVDTADILKVTPDEFATFLNNNLKKASDIGPGGSSLGVLKASDIGADVAARNTKFLKGTGLLLGAGALVGGTYALGTRKGRKDGQGQGQEKEQEETSGPSGEAGGGVEEEVEEWWEDFKQVVRGERGAGGGAGGGGGSLLGEPLIAGVSNAWLLGAALLVVVLLKRK